MKNDVPDKWALVVYSYRKPGSRLRRWCVATGDRPDQVIFEADVSKAKAIRYAERFTKEHGGSFTVAR